MKSLILIIIAGLLLCMAIPAFAQMSDYTFSSSTGTYTEITGGVLLGTETSDDQRFVDPATPAGGTVLTGPGFPIGFDFILNNYVFDRLAICNNGWISLGQSALTPSINITSTSSYTPLSSTSVITPAQLGTKVSALARDLQAQVGATLRLETIGDAPNRTCIVQFHNYKRYGTTGTGDILNFQIQLHETSNQVTFAYGPFTMGTSTTASAVQVGMRGADVTDFINRETTTDYSATTAGTTNTASCTLNNLCYPSNGLLFTFAQPQAVDNDLQALSVSGTPTPSAGAPSTYTVSVRNRGTDTQNTYTVNLMNGETVLASVPGISINSMQILDIPITWTPDAIGAIQITGKVILAGDENPANDISNPFNVTVMPEGTTVVTIGDGAQTNYYSPVSMYYKNSLFETIYYANEINTGGNIVALSFYNNFNSNVGEKPTKIWLGTTENADLSGGWIPSTALNQVFDGTVNYPSGQNLITITLQVPYTYSGGNLVMLVQRPMDTVNYTTTDLFRNQTIGTNRARRVYSSTVEYNPAAPATGTLTGQFPQTLLHFVPQGTEPIFAITPTNQDFGQVLMNTTRTQPFTIVNVGGGTLSVSEITVSGSPYFTLSNLPALPADLAGGQNTTFTLNYLPTAPGTHSATINVTDNMTRLVHPVSVTAVCVDPTIYTLPSAQNFDAVTIPALPIGWSSLVQATVTTSYVRTATTSPHSTPNTAALYNGADMTAQVLLIAPPITNTIPVNTTRVKFWAKGATTHTLKVGIMENPADAATFTEIVVLPLTAAWAEYTVSFQTYTGTGHYVTFKHGCAANSQTMYIDDVMMEVIPDNDLTALSISGNTTPTVGVASVYTVTIKNTGINPQTNYQVKLYKTGDVELASTGGPTINPDETLQVPVTWTPTVQENTAVYGQVVLTGDQNNLNNQTPPMNIAVQPEGSIVVTIGDGSQTNYYSPLAFYYKNSVFETIYYNTEIGVGGQITAISFYNNFVTTTLNNMPTKIWLGITDLNDLSAGWVNSTALTQVFDGTVNYPPGQNTITIPLQIPFTYTGGNLIMMANRPMDTVYYLTTDVFYNQTIGTNRARRIYSDTVTYDPATVTAGTLTGQFPKTSLHFVVGGMATLNGTITSGGSPLEGVTVSINTTTHSQSTGINGTYSFPFVVPGEYTVTASKIGYETQTLPVTLLADQTTTLNFNLTASAQVSVSGTVVGSDAPTVGLANAIVSLEGVLDYEGTTNALGQFNITGVLSGNTFDYSIVKIGYQTYTGTITVGSVNLNMGTIIMSEVALPPGGVVATENVAQTAVAVTWRVPGSGGGNLNTFDFELDNGGWVPSSNWTNPLGDWEWTNTYNVADFVHGGYATSEIPPTAAHSGTGLWGTIINAPYTNSGGFSYLTKTFNFIGQTNSELRFWSWNNLFGNFDYARVTVNGTIVYGPTTTTGSNPSWQEIVIDLAAYDGLAEVVIQFEEFATTVVNYAGWYIDDVYVGTAQTRSYSKISIPAEQNVSMQPSEERNRSLQGYKVWRLPNGQETNEAVWTLMTPTAITDTTYTDTTWGTLPNGQYKWAVKGIYTAGVLSPPAFSNMLRILPNDLSALSISGPPTPSVGEAFTYTVVVRNTGTTTQAAGAYTVKIMSGTTELASVNGESIAPGVSVDYPISWTPATAGPMTIFGKVVLPTDTVPTNDQTPTRNVVVQPAGTVVITVGEGTQTNYYSPVSMYYKNSLFENIYLASELNFIGIINSIGFYNDFVTSGINAKPTKVWLGNTTQTDLSTGWIPSTAMTLVFDGVIDYPTGQNLITIPLSSPFLYLEGNVVMMVQRPMDTVSYATTDKFLNQTIGTNRARRVYSNTVEYDPTAPATGTLTGQFPKTSFFVQLGGVGHLTGTVYGAGNQPLAGVNIQVVGSNSGTTNAQGQYTIMNILEGTYQVTASRYGYFDVTQTVTIPEDNTITLNFNMTQMPTVTVTGTLVGSDAPTVGLAGATINLTGYENYTGTTNASGVFTIPGVYVSQTYEYLAQAMGYQNATGEVIVGTINHDMGNIVLSEIAYSPRNVAATEATDHSAMNVAWLAPDPNAVDVTQGFESEIFPPTDWSRVVTDNGPPNTSGVYPTWCRFGTVTVGADVVTPVEGSWQAGFWWSFSHQDEWLITPQFNCPQGAFLTFDSNVFLGSANGDHYYVKASTDNGGTWNVLWDATALTGGWNHYNTPITIDLAQYTGQQIKLAWHGDDPNTSSDGLWYVWFIDDVVVANTETVIRFPESQMVAKSVSISSEKSKVAQTLPFSRATDFISRFANTRSGQTQLQNPHRETDRSLVGYRVWRLPQGQEQNETVWDLLTPANITATSFSDAGWLTLPEDTYKWAVKAIYTNNVYSLAMFSNPMVKEPLAMGTIAGLVRNEQLIPIMGATITVGTLSAVTAANGSYTLSVPEGTHTVVCTAATYITQTQENVIVNAGLTTVANFTLAPVEIDDNTVVTATVLKSNYPNPFNPETIITFDVKERAPVRIDIYNIKGQLIRTLVDEVKASGSYHITWNGDDNNGKAVASGIYNYRMQAGSYTSTRRMMLLK